MSQKKGPKREPGAKVSGMISDDFLTPPRKHGPVPSQDEAEENPTEYWLHVAWDGEEVRYPSELSKRHRGYVPTLHIVVRGDNETTMTWDRRGPDGNFVTVTPPGEGWVKVVEHSKSSEWTRRARS
jgi:hypothetical protein